MAKALEALVNSPMDFLLPLFAGIAVYYNLERIFRLLDRQQAEQPWITEFYASAMWKAARLGMTLAAIGLALICFNSIGASAGITGLSFMVIGFGIWAIFGNRHGQ